MRALWSDRPIALITCLKKLNVSGAFLNLRSAGNLENHGAQTLGIWRVGG